MGPIACVARGNISPTTQIIINVKIRLIIFSFTNIRYLPYYNTLQKSDNRYMKLGNIVDID
ncbi:MAG: hypothetical protein Kow00117_00850 [Phototrophicales bacterium]